MTREELLNSPEYWMTNIQQDLYGIIYEYMQKNDKKKKDVAELLGVSKGYVTQILSGDFDHKLSKMIELSLAFGKVPKISFMDATEYLNKDKFIVPTNEGKVFQMKCVMGANTPMKNTVVGEAIISNDSVISTHKQEQYSKTQSV